MARQRTTNLSIHVGLSNHKSQFLNGVTERTMRLLPLLVLLIVLPGAAHAAKEWPEYQGGPSRNAADVESLKIRAPWDLQVGASLGSTSSPVLSRGNILTGAMERELISVDARTGEVVWRAEGEERRLSVTPVPLGNSILWLTTGGTLRALNATSGLEEWSLQLPDGTIADFITDSTSIYVGLESGRFVKVREGNIVWTFRCGESVGSAAALWEDLVIFPCQDGYAYALDANTGELRWKRFLHEFADGTPTLSHGLVVIAFDFHAWGLDARTGEVRWDKAIEFTTRPPAADEHQVYVGTYTTLEAWDPRTGAVNWSVPVDATHAAPVLANGRVYHVDAIGTLHSYTTRGKHEGEQLVAFRIEREPIIVGDVAFLVRAIPASQGLFKQDLSAVLLAFRDIPSLSFLSVLIALGTACLITSFGRR